MTDEFELRITGMDCADCALTLRESVARLDGVQVCTVNFGTGRMRVSGSVAAAAVSGAVTALGYGVAARAAPGEHNDESVLWLRLLRSPRNALTLVGMLLIGLAFAAQAAASNLAVILFALGALAGLYFPVRAGWVALRSRRGLDMNVLMTIAALGAFAIGEHAEAATVIVLFSLGEALEGFTLERARESIRFLTALAPAEATLVQACMDCEGHRGRELPDGSGLYRTGPCPWCDTHTQTVAVASLALGDVIMVMPGERIPMDGVVRSGQSAVNQAPITGESMPVEKSVGAHVFAGTVNGEGALEIEVTRLAQDNTLARMIHLVEQAQEQKSPAQRFVDRFARLYTPAVVGVAVAVAALPPLLLGQPFLDSATGHGWLYRALTMLVIACPCALVIATPVTVISAISAAARRGVLIKGGAYLELLGAVRVVAFDKTGTLTHGRPRVIAMACTSADCTAPRDCADCDEMLMLAAAVERSSSHPLARAVVQAAEQRGLRQLHAREVRALPGRGVQGSVNGSAVLVGSRELFRESAFHALCEQVAAAERRGQTVMLVGENGAVSGYLAVSDPPRGNSREALAALCDGNAVRTVMLTGDNSAVAAAVAQSVGVHEVRAGMLPEDKMAVVRALAAENGAVAMVGDGVNDTPALAAADVGIAMGGAGTAQALETADVALMGDDLSALPVAMRLGRRSLRIMRFNIWFALLLKGAFLAAAVAGVASLWMAVFADMGASLFVTLNGMRLMRVKSLR